MFVVVYKRADFSVLDIEQFCLRVLGIKYTSVINFARMADLKLPKEWKFILYLNVAELENLLFGKYAG